MEIYILNSQLDKYQSFCFGKDADANVVYKFDGRPITEWKSLNVQVCEPNSSLPASDFPSLLLSHMPIFSQRAVVALSEILKPNGQLLSLGGDGAGYYLYNVTKLVDALDTEKAEIVRFPTTGRIMTIRRYAFLREKLENGLAIFKLKTTPRMDVFVSRNFTKAAPSAGLTGFEFIPAV